METLAMQRLRGFLRVCFGYLTLISTLVSGFMVTSLIWMAQHPHTYHYYYRGERRVAASVVLITLSRLVRFIPIIMAVIYGMAWWSVKLGKPSARRWAIAASALMVVSSIAMVTARLAFWPPGRTHLHGSFLLFQAFFFVAGILGLIVFIKSTAASMQPQSPRVRGDGTSSLLDLSVSVLALGGLWGGMILYARWGYAHQLPHTRGFVSLLVITAVILITVVLHEAAHASVGVAFGMKLRAFVIGPFQWRIRDGRWTYRFILSSFLSFGGSTGIVPSNPNQSRWVEIAMIAAGPLINLCAGLLAAWATLSAKGQPYERFWETLAFFATVNLVTFVVNLIPFRPDALYSDGARIFQLLSGGPWALLHRVFSIVLSSTVTPLRPRNYDLDAINRAAAHFTFGREALLLRLFATSHYLDTAKIPEARESYAEALRIYQQSTPKIPVELFTTFVFNSVYLHRDPVGARHFWNLFESKGPSHVGVDYWLARTALHWIENHPREARDAWNTGNVLAQQLPNAGAYNFDRDRYRIMEVLLAKVPIANNGDNSEVLSGSHRVLVMPARSSV